MTRPEGWSADMDDLYEELTVRFGEHPGVLQGFAAQVVYRRTLAHSSRPREYFASEFEGDRYAFEAVVDRGELIPIRQVLGLADGRIRCYSWRVLEDADGKLAECIEPAPELSSMTAAEFAEFWDRGAGGT